MLTLTFAPNNQISIKVHKPRIQRKGRPEIDYDHICRVDYLGAVAPTLSPTNVGGGSSNLSLTANINTSSRGGGWGFPSAQKTKFSRKAKTSLYRAGGALEHSDLGADKTAFFTGTLPGSSDVAVRGLASWSGYISNRITQWFRNHDIAYWGYAWEFQKRGALHIHAFASSENIQLLDRMIDEFRPFWISILRDVTDKSGVNLFQKKDGSEWDSFKDMLTFRSRGEWVRKSVCAYLCKYISKGSSDDLPVEYYPARWWGMSSQLKLLTQSLTETRTIELSWTQEMEIALEIQQHLQGFAVKQTEYIHPYSDNEACTFVSYIQSSEWQDCKYLFSIFDDYKSSSVSLAAKLPSVREMRILQRLRDMDATEFWYLVRSQQSRYPAVAEAYLFRHSDIVRNIGGVSADQYSQIMSAVTAHMESFN